MNEAFLAAYERELALLYDRGKEFAKEYPGIASRLGGMLQGNLDPAVDGLMQGTAFLAARVQLQIENEFSTFTRELLDQLLPNFLAPTPSAMMIQAQPGRIAQIDPAGLTFAAGAYIDARFVERDQRIQCRYRLSAPLTLWPLQIADATYFVGPGRFQALGLDPTSDTAAGLVMTLERPSADGKDKAAISALALEDLNIHLTGDVADSAALYEAIFAQTVRASVRFEDSHGDPVIVPLEPHQIEPLGFDESESFFPEDNRIFRGFILIREFFMFPRKFMGFRLRGIKRVVKANETSRMQLLFELGQSNATLAPRVKTDDFALFCAPAVNLFQETANQISLDVRKEEYNVTPSSSPSHNYEVHRILDVTANFKDSSDKVPVYPIYGAPPDKTSLDDALYYTHRHIDHVLSANERRSGRHRDYRGVDTLLSFYEPAGLDDEARAMRLHVRTLASNRHLPLHLPIGQSGADFYLTDDTSVNLGCIAGPSAPKPAIADTLAPGQPQGTIPWRLLSFLSLNFLGLDNRTPEGGVRGLREMLEIFVDIESPLNRQQIAGIESLKTRPIARSVKRGHRFQPARGIEIRLTFDERAFESASIVLFSACLERFFAEYAPVNSFTQTVVVSKQRGQLKTWPPRSGQGPLL